MIDPWGVEQEAATVSNGRARADGGHRPGRGGAPGAGRTAVVALALVAVVALATLAGAAGAGASRQPAALKTIVLASGASKLGAIVTVTAASSGVVLSSAQPVSSTLDPIGEPTVDYLVAGARAVQPLGVKVPKNYEVDTELASGPMIVAVEIPTASPSTKDVVWWDEPSLHKKGTRTAPDSDEVVAATPTGWVLEERKATTTEFVEVAAASGKTAALGTVASNDVPSVAAGDSGLAVVDDVASGSDVTYFAYTKHPHGHVIDRFSSGVTVTCTSVTTNAVGCYEENASYVIDAVDRIPVSGHAAKRTALAGLTYLTGVLVTPTVTAWVTGYPSVELFRMPAAGGKVTALTLPTRAVLAAGSDFYYGSSHPALTVAGTYRLAATAKSAVRVAPSPLSPISASAITLGPGGVAFADSGGANLPIWRRALTESGPDGVTAKKATQLAEVGLVASDSTGYGLSLSLDGSTIAFSAYNDQPTADPLSLELKTGPTTTTVTDDEGYVPFEPYGDPVTTTGGDVLFEEPGSWDLYSHATKSVKVLGTSDDLYWAMDKTDLAYIKNDGSVWVEPRTGSGSPVEVADALGSNYTVDANSLSIAGNEVAWNYDAYGTTSVFASAYRNFAKLSPAVSVPGASQLVVSTADVGVERPSTTGPGYALSAINLKTSAVTKIASVGAELTLYGDLAGWIGEDNLPRLARLGA